MYCLYLIHVGNNLYLLKEPPSIAKRVIPGISNENGDRGIYTINLIEEIYG